MGPRERPELKLENVLRHCILGGIPRRSAVVALIVGSILNLVNQGDRLIRGEHLDILKILLTYSVPYLVATYAAVAERLRSEPRAGAQHN